MRKIRQIKCWDKIVQQAVAQKTSKLTQCDHRLTPYYSLDFAACCPRNPPPINRFHCSCSSCEASMAPPTILLGPPFIHNLCVQDESPLSPIDQEPTSPRSPCMDLFFCDLSLQNLPILLESAWRHNPLTTLKIIFNFGNSNKLAFLPAILWLHQHHHLTLACNISIFSSLELLDYTLEILCRILDPSKGSGTMADIKNSDKIPCTILKKQRDISRARSALEKYVHDAQYRFLHNQISNLFADLLRDDLQFLASGRIDELSMASKLCPSLDSVCDKSTLICEGIARKLFPPESDEEYKEIDETHYAYRVRNRLRKQVLVPLRKALEAGADRVTMPTTKKDLGKKLFMLYQKDKRLLTGDSEERLTILLDIYTKGRSKVGPHHIVACLNDESVQYDAVEIRWRNIVEACAKKQEWRNCLAIYNVSGGTRNAAMDFALGMGLLISEISDEPWKGKVLTFGTDPIFCRIEGSDLRSKIEFMRKLRQCENIRFSKVFDQVLEAAVAGNMSLDRMVKKICVFTDVDFEKAANNFWATWASVRKYQSRGYEKLPEIVFWDVKECVSVPQVKKFDGLVIVKGFSDSWANAWLRKGEFATPEEMLKMVPTPEELMRSALHRKELQNLIVFD